jgi:hypothetical protein
LDVSWRNGRARFEPCAIGIENFSKTPEKRVAWSFWGSGYRPSNARSLMPKGISMLSVAIAESGTASATNVYEIDGDGRSTVGWCFVPTGYLVAGDVMLAQKIALETHEFRALAVANRFPV